MCRSCFLGNLYTNYIDISGFFVANFDRTFYNLVLHLFFKVLSKFATKKPDMIVFNKHMKIVNNTKIAITN